MRVSNPRWQTLQDSIDGEIVLPGSPAFEMGSKPFNARFHDVLPKAIVLCTTPQDVVETISFLAQHGLENATRSGGHCFAGSSSTIGVLIDVTPMNSVSVSSGTAKIGAGARLGDVYDALQKHNVTIPAGTCPPVGIAGLTLGGGLGILGRRYGVTSDSLIGAQIVLANGHIIECDERQNADLFWALRGAGGGNFGVVTSLVFRTVPVPEVTNFHLAWSFDCTVDIIDAWQRWAPYGPDELAASLKVTATGDLNMPCSVDVYGAMIGTETDTTNLLDELVVRSGSSPVSFSSELMSFPNTRRFWANLGAEEAITDGDPEPLELQQPYLIAKSEFFKRPLPREAIVALMENFSLNQVSGESRELDFMPWGGAYNRVKLDATAFVHRDEKFQLKHAVSIDPDGSASKKTDAQRWVTQSWKSVHLWGSGRVFQNFADPDLDDWEGAYYGTNYERLVLIKARYDPTEFFHFHQSLPVR